MTARRKPVRPRRDTRRRRAAPQENAAWWETATQALLTRSGYRCERCGRDLGNNGPDPAERHHRQRKAVGGDRLANVVLLHRSCHQWAHAHPQDARARGIIVSAYADPAQAPILIGGRWCLLDDTGAMNPAPCPDASDSSTEQT